MSCLLLGQLPWVSLTVAGIFPVYFTLRRWAGVGPLPAVLFECFMMGGPALWMLLQSPSFYEYVAPGLMSWLQLLGLGALSFSAVLTYLAASYRLSVSLFGLLSYLEPALLFLVAVAVLREPVDGQQLMTYSLIGLAALLVVLIPPEPCTNVVRSPLLTEA